MVLNIFYWIPIILFGSIYVIKITTNLAKANTQEKQTESNTII